MIGHKDFVIAVVISSMLVGCAEVAPWERGILAKPHMSANANALQKSVRSHIYGSREAAGNNAAVGGGAGCGCY